MVVVLLELLILSSAALAFTYVGLTAVRRVVRRGVGDGHNDVSSAIFGVGGTVYAVFLAFLVVTVWAAHDDARSNIAEEASALGTLYRLSTAMDPAAGEQLRLLVREYTHAVIEDEWPIQAARGAASERARAAGLAMFGLFGTMPPETREGEAAVDQLALNLISRIHDDRNKRTLQAQEAISPVIWTVALANGLVVIVMSFFLYPDRDWPHVVMSGMLAAMLAMFVYVVYVFGQPFRSVLPLQPDAFVHSLDVYKSVDQAIAVQVPAKAAPR
jgi:hypothetical protein